MAKDFSDAFYHSARWKRCRRDYISRVHGLCERCGNVGVILHHKILLTPDNIDNPDVTLNFDNLEFLCLECHNEDELNEHGRHKKGYNSVKLTKYSFDADGNVIPLP